MTCQDDATLTGAVSLYLGIETEAATAPWTLQQFIDAATFAHTHGITTLFIKCFEVGSKPGDIWYGGIDGFDKIYRALKATGIGIIPYGYMYGDTYNNLTKEISIAVQFFTKYQLLCLDIETEWSNHPEWATQLNTALAPLPGKVWVSCLADPAYFQEVQVFQNMMGFANVWAPQVYDDYLAGVWQNEYSQVSTALCFQPTLNLDPNFNDNQNTILDIVVQMCQAGIQAISLWEYQLAQANPTLLDNVVGRFRGGLMIRNGNGCVCDTTRWYQLETEPLPNVPASPQGTQESQDLCGPGGVIVTALSNLPNGGPLKLNGVAVNAEFIDRATDDMVDAYGKAHADGYNHINWPGADDSDMIWFLNYARDTYQRTHYQVIFTPTIDKIRDAVQAGYPVLYSCNELDLQEKRTSARPPYPWQLSAGHIVAVTGIDKDGDFICPDILNNGFQNVWPVTYMASVLAASLSWACIIQLVGTDPITPWMKPIPSADPTTWPKGFNAQNWSNPVIVWPSPGMQQQASDTWQISARFLQLAFGATAPYTTGIALAWQARYAHGKNYGPPICTEVDSVDWSNKPVKVQLFAAGVRAEWDTSCHWFDQNGPLA